MSQLLEKLRKVALYSDGVFITGQLLTSLKETKYFNYLLHNHPSYFDILDVSKTKILRLTQSFNNQYLTPKPLKKISTEEEVMQRILWSALLLQDSLDFECPKTFFKMGKERFLIDNFSHDKTTMKALVSANSIQGVMTIFPRESFFRSINVTPLVPALCRKRWVKAHLSLYFQRYIAPKVSSSELVQSIPSSSTTTCPAPIFERFLERGIWPENLQQCHKEKKFYPAFKNALTGEEKWEMDKAFLELNKKIPDDYFFGIYA